MHCLLIWKKIGLGSLTFGLIYGLVNWAARAEEIFAAEVAVVTVILMGYGVHFIAAVGRGFYNGYTSDQNVMDRIGDGFVDWAVWTVPTSVVLFHVVTAANAMQPPWDAFMAGIRGAAYFATFVGSGFNTLTLLLGSDEEAKALLSRMKRIVRRGRAQDLSANDKRSQDGNSD